MNNLWNSYKPHVSKRIIYVLLGLSLLGLMDASYLTANHYLGESVACSVVKGCDIVLTSKYATVFGVPVALAGVIYYAALFLLAYYYLITNSEKLFRLLSLVAGSGFLATLYLVYLQLFVIEAICQYCMISAIGTTIIVIIVCWAWVKSIKEIKNK